jgi:hypothetical protein
MKNQDFFCFHTSLQNLTQKAGFVVYLVLEFAKVLYMSNVVYITSIIPGIMGMDLFNSNQLVPL